MRRIAFWNEKGGTCKTTLCVNVAARLAARGRRVLVVDLDTQGHAGKSLGVDVRGLSPTVHDWLLDPLRTRQSRCGKKGQVWAVVGVQPGKKSGRGCS